MTGRLQTEWDDVDRTASWLADPAMAREAATRAGRNPHWTERHLQCVWYDERLRPAPLQTLQGEPVAVLNPGRWNLEAGPDFLDAELRVGNPGRSLRGDVEIHIRPPGWTQHRHGEDPRYADVVLQVTYYPAPLLPESAAHRPLLQVAVQESLAGRRGFSFEDIDTGAYPHAMIPATPRPCGEALSGRPPASWVALLEAAGRDRLRERSSVLSARLNETGDLHQVFYEETMAMLGAKKNSASFRRVAEKLPLSDWPGESSCGTHYARLLGTAGLLPDPERMQHPEAQTFARELWDLWFRSGGGTDAMPDDADWVLSGVRPLNHPLRRMAAAAGLFAEPRRILQALRNLPDHDPEAWARQALRLLCGIEGPAYWQLRQSLDSAPHPRSTALLGSRRAAVILANVLVPLIMIQDPASERLAEALPPEEVGAPAREMAFRLFGRDHNPALYARSGLRQQGLLAIYQNACLRARNGCEQCALAANLRKDG